MFVSRNVMFAFPVTTLALIRQSYIRVFLLCTSHSQIRFIRRTLRNIVRLCHIVFPIQRGRLAFRVSFSIRYAKKTNPPSEKI